MKRKLTQRGKNEYTDEFLEMVLDRIASKIPGTDMDIEVDFRRSIGHPGAEGVHRFDPGRNVHRIEIDKKLFKGGIGLENICATLAHEIGHAVQWSTGRLRHGDGNTGIWDGKIYSYDNSWEARPWELDAMDYEHYGTSVYNELKREGVIPDSRHAKVVAGIYKKYPDLVGNPITMEDLPDSLTREQLLLAIDLAKKHPKMSLDELLARL